jgi:hypothetical protein
MPGFGMIRPSEAVAAPGIFNGAALFGWLSPGSVRVFPVVKTAAGVCPAGNVICVCGDGLAPSDKGTGALPVVGAVPGDRGCPVATTGWPGTCVFCSGMNDAAGGAPGVPDKCTPNGWAVWIVGAVVTGACPSGPVNAVTGFPGMFNVPADCPGIPPGCPWLLKTDSAARCNTNIKRSAVCGSSAEINEMASIIC